MNSVSFQLANNWSDHAELQRAIPWRTASPTSSAIMFETEIDSELWQIRLNDFPDEPLYTVLIAGDEIIHFDDWPAFWGTRPAFPRS